MERPSTPGWWRGALVAVALLQAPLVLADAIPQARDLQLDPAVWTLAGAILGAALAGSLVRRGGRDRIAGWGGVGAAVVAAFLSEVPFHVLAWLGPSVAVAVTLARPHRIATPIACAGYLAALVSMRLFLRHRGPLSEIPSWMRALSLASGALLVLGLLLHAAAARSTASPPLDRRPRLALAAGGTLLLLASWLIGGHLLFLPIWPLAIALLVGPPLARARAWPAGAALVAAVALLGFVPAGTCVNDPWSDAEVAGREGDADARPQRVTLGGAGVHGPRWASGGGFGGYVVRCPAGVLALGVAWDLALVGAVALAAVRASAPRPEPA